MKLGIRKFLTILVALSMILSMHVSLAAAGGGNLELGDPYEFLVKFEWKGNDWEAEGSSNSVTVTGSAISVSFESETPIYAVVIKGATDNDTVYFNGVYRGELDNLGLSNPGGNPDISNISFYTMTDEEPWEGTIKIIKSFEEGDDHPLYGVSFTLSDGQGFLVDESTNSDGEAVFEKVPAGTYTLTENVPQGYTSSLGNGITIELPDAADNQNYLEISVKNSLDEEEEFGSLKVHKGIMRISGSVDANLGDGEFKVRLTSPQGEDSEVRELTIKNPADHVVFEDLPFGIYTLEEIDAYHPELEFSDYYFANSGNQNHDVISNEVTIDSENEIEIWLINKVGDPWEGNIRVIKSIPGVQAPNELLEGFEFTLSGPNDYEETASTDEYGEAEFTGLAEGEYLLEEDDYVGYTSSIPDGFTIDLPYDADEENDNYAIVRVTNTPIPDDWKGVIRVEKSITGEDDPDLSGIEFTLSAEGMQDLTQSTNSSGIVEFINLPEGIYTLTEDVPEGYRSSLPSEGLEIELPEEANENDIVTVQVTNRLIPDAELGEIEVAKIVQNRLGSTMTSDNTRFYFELQMLGEGWITIDSGSILGNGTLVFNNLEDGEYRVREVNIDDDFNLISPNNILVEIEDGSSEEVEFVNRERPLPPDDDDDDEEEEDEPEDEPENEPEVLEITVVEPIPEATPTPEPEPVIEVVEEVIPLATLPKTGTFDSSTLGGIGAALLGLGLLLKKKED